MYPILYHLDDIPKNLDPAFSIRHHNKYITIDYNYAHPGIFNTPLERELRGIKFSSKGDILARPYHKFFNLGERNSTVDFSKPYLVLDKLDGSLVHPIILDGEIHWCTRAGITDVSMRAAQWASTLPAKALELLHTYHEMHCTPLFEWLDPNNPIVVRYPKAELVLTGIRDNHNGDYLPLAGPLLQYFRAVQEVPYDEVHAPHREGTEGIVIRGTNWVKVKREDYVQLHRARDTVNSPHIVAQLWLQGKLDDLLPSLQKEDLLSVAALERTLHNMVQHDNKIVSEFVHNNQSLSDKDFAIKCNSEMPDYLRSVAFQVRQGVEPHKAIKEKFLTFTRQQSKFSKFMELFK